MNNQQWIDGVFEETDTDYTIAGMNILYKSEEDYLKKGVELLCDKVKPTSVLEFGFGKGWTASEFQKYGVNRHVILEPNKENYQMALEWKSNYSSDIEILNIFSWQYDYVEEFDLIYSPSYQEMQVNLHQI
jgi:spermidine synthase